MNKQEMADFQNGLRENFGGTIRVKVEKRLNQQEREELISHIRHQTRDFNSNIEIIEPATIDFDYEVIMPYEKEVTDNATTTDDLSTDFQSQLDANKQTTDKSRGYIYGEHLVVQQNRLLNAITNLKHNERRLILLLTSKVRKAVDMNPMERTFEVTALEFAEEYQLNVNGTYKTLSEISDSLLEKAFWFYDLQKDGKTTKKGSSWVAECEYLKGKGKVLVTLTDSVTEMLTVFDKSNPFTQYERHHIIKLGSYGIIMFELASSCLYLKSKQKSYSVKFLREKFNCLDTYPRISDFKRNVLDVAIKEIEIHTNLRITYTQKKAGRTVESIAFHIQSVDSVDSDKILRVFSKNEISKFAWQLKDKHEVIGNFPQSIRTPIETQKEIEKRMADPNNYELYLKYLNKHTDFKEDVHMKNLIKKTKKSSTNKLKNKK